jgi:DNA polymerase III alpha subunit
VDNLLNITPAGTSQVSDQGIIELAYQDRLHSFFEWQNPQTREEYLNSAVQLDNLPFEIGTQNVEDRQWFTPPEYSSIDLQEFVIARCYGEDQIARAKKELELISQLKAEHIFKHLIFLIDQWRSKNLVWGVGRGSSVSCFVLYIIGINKINPLDYDLDHREFFKI